MDILETLKQQAVKLFKIGDNFIAGSTSFRHQHRKVIESTADATETELEFIQGRARHLFWNNGIANNAILSFVANLGVTEVILVDENDKEDVFWMGAWGQFKAKCNHDGFGTFDTLQTICAATVATEGEIFIRRKNVFTANKFIPFQLETILSKNVPIGHNNLVDGVINGIGFKDGKPVSYLVKPYQKDLNAIQESVKSYPYGFLSIPGSKMIHLFNKVFPDQKRGLPFITAVISTLWNHQDLEDSISKQAINFASFTYAIKNGINSGQHRQNPVTTVKSGFTESGSTEEKNKVTYYETEAGQFLHGDVDVQLLQPQGIKSGINEFLGRMQKVISVCVAATSFQVDGNCGEYNYSSMRAALVSIEGRLSLLRTTVFTPILVLTVVNWWLDSVLASFPGKKRPKVLLRYPKSIVPNLLELMKAYEIGIKNGILPMSKIYDELDIDPDEFNSSFQELYNTLMKAQADNNSKATANK